MYLSYYGLSAKPFQINTDPRFLWLGSEHKEALAHFKYGLLESNGYVVLIGAVGTGKTTLVNALVRMLDDRVLVADINYPSLNPSEFLTLVARAYDPSTIVSGKADCLHFLYDFLRRAHGEGKVVLLVIDEAHRLSETLLEEIRLLSNMEQDGEKLINIFFVGQTELKHKLQSSRALRQRITLFYHLQPLSEADTRQYIRHRLKKAGTEAQLFTPQAMQVVYKFSQGLPRLINKLCDRALLTGYVKERTTINASIILECVREINLIDPIISSAIIARLPRQIRFMDRRLWPRAWFGLEGKLNAAFQQLRTIGPKAAAIAGANAAAEGADRGHKAVGRFIQRHRSRIPLAATAGAVLLTSGWMFAEHWHPPARQTVTLATARPASALKAPPIPAGDPSPAPNHPAGAGAQTAPPAVQPAQPPPPKAEVLPPQPPPIHAPTVPPPSFPSKMEIATALLAKNDYEAVIELFEAHNPPSPVHSAEAGALYARALVGRATELMAHSPKEAEMLLRKAVTADSRNVEALVQLGNLYTRSNDLPQAIDIYRKAIQLDPRQSDALFNLGFILASTGMYHSAEKMLMRVVQLRPDYLDKALFNLAVVQQKIGKRQASLASLEAAVAIQPGNKRARAYLEELKTSMRRSR
jgi:type II secretory pathway predicted ATPase ExeA/Tfp pilus assembly protein PilF